MLRLRLKGGALRVYTGTTELYHSLTALEVFSLISKKEDCFSYVNHARIFGVWICVNQINTVRRKIEPEEIENLLKS